MNRIAIYLRLSKEDEFASDESNSITNQRELILSYIRKDKTLRKMEVIELKDDGYSGKNMNRPGMQQLLEMVRHQQISVIIVKDMSRFSRDYLVLGQYTEQILPFMGIRFIAINDSYDSEECTGGVCEIDVAFKALLYDFYSEDMSQKIKSALMVRKREGRFMNVYAPYGYRKCADDRHKLEIEPEGAAVIRRIYSDYASGLGINKIAQNLNIEGVKTPADYVRDRDGRDYFRRGNNGNTWSSYAVSRILRNDIFGGIATVHKYHTRRVGGGGGVPYPKETWERIEGAFPALIDKETFEKVRAKTNSHRHQQRTAERHMLQGKIYCGNCGYAMAHTNAGRHSFFCSQRFTAADPTGCVKSINDSILEEILLELIREKIRNRIGMEDVIREEEAKRKGKISEARSRRHSLEESVAKIEADLFHAYEAYREGTTEKETYLEQKETYEQMLERLKENLEKQVQAVERMENESPVPEGWTPDSEYLQIEALDRTIIELLICRVLVYRDYRIEVIWNFKNEE